MAWASRGLACGVVLAALLSASAPVFGQVLGFEMVTVGAPGNPGRTITGPLGKPETIGSVGYEYRIARTELATRDWVRFVNVVSTRGGSGTFFGMPAFWGASQDPSYTGPGIRWVVSPAPGAGLWPVRGMTWREAAMYCNWLHNGMQDDPATLLNGAYDASTFITLPNGAFLDQRTRSPGARFWIPSRDEWIKAVHYDPDRHGQGQGGFWLYPNMKDRVPIGGPPGVGEANFGWSGPGPGIPSWTVPVGSYPEQRSPWGLLDTAGGVSEFTEWVNSAVPGGPADSRGIDGSSSTDNGASIEVLDFVDWHLSIPPEGASFVGLRVAGIVPAPATVWLVVMVLGAAGRRRR